MFFKEYLSCNYYINHLFRERNKQNYPITWESYIGKKFATFKINDPENKIVETFELI